MTPKILVVDDDEGVRYTLRGVLEDAGMEVVDAIKRGQGQNGAVIGEPDRMVTVTVTE